MTDDLERRLRAVESSRDPVRGFGGATTYWYRNPDGPEAADKLARLREALERIATLSNQREEPWPEGSEMDRLHFWRDRVIDAAEAARQALQEGSRHE